MRTTFLDIPCHVVVREYRQGGTALRLIVAEDTKFCHVGEPVCTATVCLGREHSDELPVEGEVAIKNHDENAGVLDALIAAGAVEKPHRSIVVGFTAYPVCRLTNTAREELHSASQH